MKKRVKIILTVIVVVFIVIFIAASSFIGLQVFAGSTQLVTNEETKEVPYNFWRNMV